MGLIYNKKKVRVVYLTPRKGYKVGTVILEMATPLYSRITLTTNSNLVWMALMES
tara:strand:- start:107 stop:271 length:165 start_codon:yes stop_codon:yes gene_type:complete